MDSKYTNPIKAGIFDEEGQPFSLLNPVPTEISNFPTDYALPAAQFNALNQEATQELIRLLLVSLDSKFNSLGQKPSLNSHPVVLSSEQEVILDAIRIAVQNLDLDIEDIATEATLAAFKTAFDNRDLATETTLASLESKLNTLGQKASIASAPVVLSTEQEAILEAIRTAAESSATDLATEATLELVRLLLVSLDSKLNTLGQKASVASAPVVLSTEQEAILDAIKTATENLDLDIEDIATEATLDGFRVDFNSKVGAHDLDTGIGTESRQGVNLRISADGGSIEAKGQQVMASSIPVTLASDHSVIDVSISGGNITLPTGAATEAKQDDQITLLTSLDGKFNSLGQKTSAASAPVVLSSEQEVILDAIRVAVQNLDLDIEDIATEATLSSLDGKVGSHDLDLGVGTEIRQGVNIRISADGGSIEAKGQQVSASSIPAVLSTEQEAILTAIKDASEGSATGLAQETTLQALLTAFNLEDFATQTTLAALLAAFNAEDFASETTLAAFKSAFDLRDLATETTLAALRTDFNAEDFASETTLAAFKTAFDNRDLATETTLSSIDGKLNSLGQKTKAGSVPVTFASDQESIKTSDELDGVAAFNTINVGTTAVELKVGASRLAGRRYVHIQPKGQGIFWGYGNTVTVANGTELFKNQIIILPSSDINPIWLIGTTGTVDVRIGELG